MDLPSVADIRRRLPAPVGVPVPTVLEIDLTRGLLEAPATDPLSALRQRQTPMLTDVVAGLRRGSRDPSVVGAVVLVGAGTSAITQAEELGAALRDFSAADKQCVAWAETFGELGAGTVPYYLAAHAGQVWMQPTGMLGLTGVALSATAIRGVLDKLGVEPQIGRRHEYKSAAESITESTISEPNREMTQRLVDSVMEQVRARLVESRGVSEAEAKQVDAASPMSAARAVDLGLVDRLAYRDELYAAVRGWGGEDEVRLLFAHRYAQHQASRPGEQIRRRRAPVVAVVEVRGGISMGRSQPGGPGRGPSTGSDTVCAALRLAGADESVKAVVLRVDSPGGSYLASDAIRRQVLALRETGRPVVVSMAELAASGGYFVSMPADHIVASPGTLTGSIGVFGGKVVLSETFDKIGLVREAIGSGGGCGFGLGRPRHDVRHDPAVQRRGVGTGQPVAGRRLRRLHPQGRRGSRAGVRHPRAQGPWTGQHRPRRVRTRPRRLPWRVPDGARRGVSPGGAGPRTRARRPPASALGVAKAQARRVDRVTGRGSGGRRTRPEPAQLADQRGGRAGRAGTAVAASGGDHVADP